MEEEFARRVTEDAKNQCFKVRFPWNTIINATKTRDIVIKIL